MNEKETTVGETTPVVKTKDELIKERQQMIYAYGELSLQFEGLQQNGEAINIKMREVKQLLITNVSSINSIIEAETDLKSDTD